MEAALRILKIPEVAALDAPRGMVRIPSEVDVPTTDRVRRLIDTASFRRLARIGQLGLVSLVYPGATHSRFEHSLGVYRTALLFLKQLSRDPRFVRAIQPHEAELFIVTALLHDLGHWPYCHPIEDLGLNGVPRHEEFVTSFLLEDDVATPLREDWGLDPRDVLDLLAGRTRTPSMRILDTMLSGPIDIDKLDYLARDSLHAGVPYGHHFDRERLIGSLCLNRDGDGLALTEKGKTAAELLVFARYVMFSEVYWHHGVRSATAMLQRAFYLLHDQLDFDALFRLSDADMIDAVRKAAGAGPAATLLDGLFGSRRRLYKRLARFSHFQEREIYERLARRPYRWVADWTRSFARLVAESRSAPVSEHDVLLDAPPAQREVEFDIEIFFPKEDEYLPLEQVSPVVRALAKEQFDDYVKRVRLFAHPRHIDALRETKNLRELVIKAEEETSRREAESPEGAKAG